jgi:hypothetical protein
MDILIDTATYCEGDPTRLQHLDQAIITRLEYLGYTIIEEGKPHDEINFDTDDDVVYSI